MMLSLSGRNAHKGVHTQEIIGIKYQYLIETIYLQGVMYGNVFIIVYSQERTGEKMNHFLIVLPL
jgi:hypothetical protein